MKSLSGSLAALALLAVRDGNMKDAARLLSQSAAAPDSELFLEETLADNYVASAIVNSVSEAKPSLADSVAALSSALEINAEEETQQAMYGDDESLSVSFDDDTEIDLTLVDEEDNPAPVVAQSSSLIKLRFN
ncbi:hypothetical protein YOLOSWAG_136 [Erwinia phage vB_EamM_Yoloswag]|uniref:Uncharacterized protein n=1 Tax=Erwinia phage vB_EamM_Yoloswag TaxID=1958956 RepID=A0A1S6L366_9CAUD|nr:hypothetical protein HOR66_gp136 [Erwinia phage vB_EamM_Yoloswag]AQT28616.1 hypothetical protein YOLOSWAG_136 [Erwinia phage vB_EamM_Yoloswag]